MPVMKHFLQRFEAGADRFAGVDTVPASNGAPILTSSIAHLELKVCCQAIAVLLSYCCAGVHLLCC